MSEYSFSEVGKSDFQSICDLAKENGGNESMRPEKLEHWYIDNPSKMYTFWKVSDQSGIQGYASTNNFPFDIDGDTRNVAMAQNVLTSNAVRGKGLFSKLYFHTEEQNEKQYAISHYLTFTNENSTPIFLNKFGYERAQCPDLFIFLITPIDFLSSEKYEVLNSTADIPTEDIENSAQWTNAMKKSTAYITWRYSQYEKGKIVTLRRRDGGYIILKKEKRKGVSIYLVVDILCPSLADVVPLLKVARKYCAQHLVPILLHFKLPEVSYSNYQTAIKRSDRFNLLVKCTDGSVDMTKLPYSIFFGDMDFI